MGKKAIRTPSPRRELHSSQDERAEARKNLTSFTSTLIKATVNWVFFFLKHRVHSFFSSTLGSDSLQFGTVEKKLFQIAQWCVEIETTNKSLHPSVRDKSHKSDGDEKFNVKFPGNLEVLSEKDHSLDVVSFYQIVVRASIRAERKDQQPNERFAG